MPSAHVLSNTVVFSSVVAAVLLLLLSPVNSTRSTGCQDESGLRFLYDPTDTKTADCFTNCYEQFCSCSGNRDYDPVSISCVGSVPDSLYCTPSFTLCIRSYTICVAVTSYNTTLPASCASWARTTKSFLNQYTSDTKNTSFTSNSLYAACAEYTCLMNQRNASSTEAPECTPLPSVECPAPFPNQQAKQWTPAPWAPIPTTSSGSPAVDTTRVDGTLSIPGDFSSFFSAVQTKSSSDPNSAAAAKYDAMLTAVQSSLSTLIGFPVTVVNLTQGSLVAAFTTTVPSSSIGGVSSSLTNAVNTPQSSWLAPVAAQYATYYPTTPLSPAIGLIYTTTSIPGSTSAPIVPPDSSSSTACDTGCVAGIVIGAAVALVILVGCLISWCRRKQKPEEAYQKTSSSDKQEAVGVSYSPRETRGHGDVEMQQRPAVVSGVPPQPGQQIRGQNVQRPIARAQQPAGQQRLPQGHQQPGAQYQQPAPQHQQPGPQQPGPQHQQLNPKLDAAEEQQPSVQAQVVLQPQQASSGPTPAAPPVDVLAVDVLPEQQTAAPSGASSAGAAELSIHAV